MEVSGGRRSETNANGKGWLVGGESLDGETATFEEAEEEGCVRSVLRVVENGRSNDLATTQQRHFLCSISASTLRTWNLGLWFGLV